MRFPLACLLVTFAADALFAQTADTHRAAVQRIAFYADQFAQTASHMTAKETLEQTRLDEKKVLKPHKKGEPWPPVIKRTIVSQYGYAVTGSGVHEVRQIVSVDGKPVKASGSLLEALATGVTAETDEKRQKLMLDIEKHGLRGMVVDFAQIILLFSKGAVQRYEFEFQKEEDVQGTLYLIYRFNQIDGQQAVTIFEGKNPVKKKLQGEIWLRRTDLIPLHIVLQTEHADKKQPVQDVTTITYGTMDNYIAPQEVKHQQFRNGTLHVEDLFQYSEQKITQVPR